MERNTPDNKSEKDFPGYPASPEGQDITDKRNGAQQVDMSPDAMGPNARTESAEQRAGQVPTPTDVSDADSDVTEEDKQMLSASDQGRDMDDSDKEESVLDTTDEDGDPLNEASAQYGQTGADLDVPGSENDDADENIGEEDEENNYYSLGGDNHENLDEDNSWTMI